ncbi:MAG: diaminopimelate epimerase [Lachnospiraceae bacterium]|jgi:diaminopimelate epimerase|nr:diaminopimelate epimerase [Lachnospiraceae bacterium]
MKFTKMHGISNDYVYVNCFEETVRDPSWTAQYISPRRTAVGSDGLILIAPSKIADCRMIMYNADGSEGAMCGNGIRCVGKYAYDHGIAVKNPMTVETKSGIKTLSFQIEEGKVGTVTVDMGIPQQISKVPEPITVSGEGYEFVGISMGNPHAVYFMDSIDSLNLEDIGPAFEHHKRFPDRTNTEFIQIFDRNHIKMRVWERGSGETYACGTGAAASAVAAILMGYTENKVEVQLLGGTLSIFWDPESGHVFMTGPAQEVYEGEIFVPEKPDSATTAVKR